MKAKLERQEQMKQNVCNERETGKRISKYRGKKSNTGGKSLTFKRNLSR